MRSILSSYGSALLRARAGYGLRYLGTTGIAILMIVAVAMGAFTWVGSSSASGVVIAKANDASKNGSVALNAFGAGTGTATPTNTSGLPPSATFRPTGTATLTATRTPTSTNTPIPPTQTPGGPSATPVPTDTPGPPTQTPIPECGLIWRPVTSPNVGSNENYLKAVAAVSANDVWAVGWYRVDNIRTETLTMHYTDGQWTRVPSPNVGAGGNELHGVVAVSANDIWAVGYYRLYGVVTDRTLIMHYTDGVWTVVDSPNPGSSFNELRGVAAVSADEIWAVGLTDGNVNSGALTLHYTNGEWTVVTNSIGGALEGVTVVSADDVWAVGEVGGGYSQTLTAHYTNDQWTVVPSPSPGQYNHVLHAVAAVSANDVWAVGEYGNHSIGYMETLILHYTNGAWTVVPSPGGAPAAYALFGVAAVSANDVWAVGEYVSETAFQTLTIHYSDPCVTPTPTSIATQTVTPTATMTPGVEATATACTLSFPDVPSDSTFYPFIRCLACRGIISGYDDGTFRPGNDVTRSQIAKMVSNAAGFDEDPGAQIYEDVDQTNGFYDWINRLSGRGYMGGYPCGTVPEEPCNPPEDRPYFRPFANATRGQLAKIVSNAAGFDDTPVGQIFADVATDNAFYVWVERLASRGIMGGYVCGGEGEPCDSEERPYFRPYNNVTRGQTSKIVAGAFFPDCQTPGRR